MAYLKAHYPLYFYLSLLNSTEMDEVKTKKYLQEAKAHNLKEKNQCVIEHAEIIAIKRASKKLKTWHLDDCEMYVTLEPCKMCCGAIEQSRLKKVYYGAKSYIFGNVESNVSRETLEQDNNTNVSRETYVKLSSKEASKIMTDFFKTKRK